MRIDKFLKVSRLIKRRTVAKDACDKGRIIVNGNVCKAGHDVKIGDTVVLQFASGSLKVRVLNLQEKQGKEFAETMYEIID